MAGGDSLGAVGRCCVVNAQVPASLPHGATRGPNTRWGPVI